MPRPSPVIAYRPQFDTLNMVCRSCSECEECQASHVSVVCPGREEHEQACTGGQGRPRGSFWELVPGGVETVGASERKAKCVSSFGYYTHQKVEMLGPKGLLLLVRGWLLSRRFYWRIQVTRWIR